MLLVGKYMNNKAINSILVIFTITNIVWFFPGHKQIQCTLAPVSFTENIKKSKDSITQSNRKLTGSQDSQMMEITKLPALVVENTLTVTEHVFGLVGQLDKHDFSLGKNVSNLVGIILGGDNVTSNETIQKIIISKLVRGLDNERLDVRDKSISCGDVLSSAITSGPGNIRNLILNELISTIPSNGVSVREWSLYNHVVLLGKYLQLGINIGEKGFQMLESGLDSKDYSMQRFSVEALGKAIESGMDIDDKIFNLLLSKFSHCDYQLERSYAIALSNRIEKLDRSTQYKLLNILNMNLSGKSLDGDCADALGRCLLSGESDIQRDSLIIFDFTLRYRSSTICSDVLKKYINEISGAIQQSALQILVWNLNSKYTKVQRSCADALGVFLEHGTSYVEDYVLETLLKTISSNDPEVRYGCAHALAKGLLNSTDNIRKKVTNILMSGVENDWRCVFVLGEVIDIGVTVDENLLNTLIRGMTRMTIDENNPDNLSSTLMFDMSRLSRMTDHEDNLRAGYARLLGKILGKKMDTEEKAMVLLEDGLNDADINVRENCAMALAPYIDRVPDQKKRKVILNILLLGLDNYRNSDTIRLNYADAIYKILNSRQCISDEEIKILDRLLCINVVGCKKIKQSYSDVLIKWAGLSSDKQGIMLNILKSAAGSNYFREFYTDVIIKILYTSEELQKPTISALLIMLKSDVFDDAKEFCIRILGKALNLGINIGQEGLDILFSSLGNENQFVRESCVVALSQAIEKETIPFISFEEIDHHHDFLKTVVIASNVSNYDIELLYKICMILIIHSNFEKISDDEIVFIAKVVDTMPAGPKLKKILDALRRFSLDKSPQAQTVLENKIQAIVSRKGPNITISEKDEMLIDSIIGSFRESSLVAILVDRRFSMQTRIRIVNNLASKSYIDSEYSNLSAESAEKYLDMINRIYDEFRTVPAKILSEKLISAQMTIEDIRSARSKLEEIVSKRNYRTLILALSEDEILSATYHLLYQSPYRYFGTNPLSYDLFRELIKLSAEKLQYQNTRVIKLIGKGLILNGRSIQETNEILSSLFYGNAPLPKNSKYLDEYGDFIPQEVDTIMQTESADAIKQAQTSLASSMYDMVLCVKISSLINQLGKNLEKHQECAAEYHRIESEIKLGADFSNILNQLMDLNDKMFPLQQRRDQKETEIVVMEILSRIISLVPMFRNMVGNIQTQNLPNGKTLMHLETVEIDGLIKYVNEKVREFQIKKLRNKLDQGEKKIIGVDAINYGTVFKIFFSNLKTRLLIKEDSPMMEILEDLEGHIMTAYENYVNAVHSDNQNQYGYNAKKLYVTLIAKHNLIEFWSFANGAHCCLTADPKISRGFDHDGSVFIKEMPRYIADATHFWFEFSTEKGGGKQIGWLECWFGIDENRKVFVGTELMYLNPAYHDTNLQKALLKKVEEILFSVGVTKIVQFGENPASNALLPPDTYEEETADITKLQSLQDCVYEDGSLESLYEDTTIPPNIIISQKGMVKHNPYGVLASSQIKCSTGVCECLQISA